MPWTAGGAEDAGGARTARAASVRGAGLRGGRTGGPGAPSRSEPRSPATSAADGSAGAGAGGGAGGGAEAVARVSRDVSRPRPAPARWARGAQVAGGRGHGAPGDGGVPGLESPPRSWGKGVPRAPPGMAATRPDAGARALSAPTPAEDRVRAVSSARELRFSVSPRQRVTP